MTVIEKISVTCTGLDNEDMYFARQEAEKIQNLRKNAEQETDTGYRENHKHHCFRCGTQSLVEVDHKGIKIDVCVNEGCGAVHLDPGELDQIVQEDAGTVKRVHMAVMSIFR